MKKIILSLMLIFASPIVAAQVCTGPTSPGCPKGDYKFTTQYSCDDGIEVKQVSTISLDNNTGTWTSTGVGTYHTRTVDPNLIPDGQALTTYTLDCNGTWTKPVRNGLFQTTNCNVTDQARYSFGQELPRQNIDPYNVTQFDFQVIFNPQDADNALSYFDPDSPQMLDFGNGAIQTRYCNGTGQLTKHKANNTFPTPTVNGPIDPIPATGLDITINTQINDQVNFDWDIGDGQNCQITAIFDNVNYSAIPFPVPTQTGTDTVDFNNQTQVGDEVVIGINCQGDANGDFMGSLEVPVILEANPITAGFQIYNDPQQGCASCHGGQGQGTVNAPPINNTNDCPTCGNLQNLTLYIDILEPLGNPSSCTGQCATDVANYIWIGFLGN